MQIFNWIKDRAIEPSTWAAAAVACVAVAFLVDYFWDEDTLAWAEEQ